MAYLQGVVAASRSKLELGTEGALYDKIRFRQREAGIGCALESITDYTLVECMRGGEVLLGLKKRGLGVGKWNGFGGKVEVGESAYEGAKRELREECGLEAEDLEWRAMLLFTFRDSGKLMRVHVFVADKFKGEPVETDEMRPMWFHKSEIPYADMWADDLYWLPKLLAGDKFMAWFDYMPGGEHTNKVVDSLLVDL
ncbi:hypothetical protein CTAYLR_008408 [Chrysophaeum taylorii]|uniref:Oxidized purine nucleoside triphosphate hydrolase n=1 Tax=Chrysophaeum taylorii TaxID=2483200 RepID=A0AAD7ULB7_9STRA|nr:hypothetical protein CTAYLR_008408 [Chrysophaeum taylorii]